MDGSEDHPDHVQFREWGEDRPTPSSKTKEPTIMPNAVVATARIFERLPVPHSTRTRKVLRYTPGHQIPAAEAARLNVKADGTQSSIPTADVDASGVIPLPAKKAPAKRKAAAKKAAPRKRA